MTPRDRIGSHQADRDNLARRPERNPAIFRQENQPLSRVEKDDRRDTQECQCKEDITRMREFLPKQGQIDLAETPIKKKSGDRKCQDRQADFFDVPQRPWLCVRKT